MIRVLVWAKTGISRAGLESLVRADPRFETVGDGYRTGALVRAVREYSPDVVLLDSEDIPDLYSPGEPGTAAFILLLENPRRVDVLRNLQRGVRAMLLRDSVPQEITAAIEAAALGLAVVSPEIVDVLVPATPEWLDQGDAALEEPLTSRESEILSLLAEGAGNKEIASRLRISEHTVKFHVSSILAKLGATTRADAVGRGYRRGLIVM